MYELFPVFWLVLFMETIILARGAIVLLLDKT